MLRPTHQRPGRDKKICRISELESAMLGLQPRWVVQGVAQLLNSFLRLTAGTTFCCENLQRQAKWTPKCCALGRCSPQPSLTLLVTRCARYFTRCLSVGNYKLQASSTACLRTAIERCCRCSVPGSAFTAGSPGRRHSVRHFLPVRRQRTLFCERFARAALLCRC